MKNATSYAVGQLSKIGDRLANPFPGLRPFGIDESHLFFGREGQSDEILLKLAENRFSAVLGFSGSGKSSLIYCGLIPILLGGFMTEAGSNWRVVVMRPGTSPIDNLAHAMATQEQDYASQSADERLIREKVLATVLRSSSFGLVEAFKDLRKDKQENVLILVDQFEEIFRYKKVVAQSKSDVDETSLFVSSLVEAVRYQDEPIYIALTMRSDFIGECSAYPELTQMINNSHYLIPQMNREQKRSAIEGPVAVGGGQIAPRLVQQLLNDVGESPDQLPILQHALMRTWQHWKENRKGSESMDLDNYNAIGTLKEALSQHANEAYDALDKREQRICEVMFKALTEKGADNQSIRRPTKLSVISSIAGVSEEDVVRVVDKFREPRRSLLMPAAAVRLQPSTIIDISHESLMRIWTRLTTWLEEEALSAEMYSKLSEAAARYQKGVAGLWKMPDLQLAVNWKEENQPTLVWGRRYHPAFERTMMFLNTSWRAHQNEQRNKEILQRRRIRNNRILALVGAVGALVCIFLAYTSSLKADEAERAQVKAAEEALRATEQAEIARQQQTIAEEAQSAAEQNLILANEARANAERSAELARIAEERAKEQAEIAEQQRQQALIQEKRAGEEAERARQAQQRAEIAKADADKLRYQAIASSMASKVEDLRDSEQKALIAMQAFNFYEAYGDKEYNADIYDGVYNAYKAVSGQSVNQWGPQDGHVRTAVFSRDGNAVISAGSQGVIYLWSIANKGRDPKILLDMSEISAVFRSLHLDESGNRLVAAGDSPFIYVVDARNGGVLKEIRSPSRSIYDLQVFPSENEYVSVGENRLLIRGSLLGDQYEVIGESNRRIRKIALSPDGALLATANEEGQIHLWNLLTGRQSLLYTVSGNFSVHAIRFSPSGRYLAFGDETGKLYLWNMETQHLDADLNAHYSRINHLSFRDDERLLLTASWDRSAKMYDLTHINDLPITFADHNDWVWSASFSPNGEQVLTASGDHLMRIYPTLTQKMAETLCGGVSRNISRKEWDQFVGEDIPYGITCADYPADELQEDDLEGIDVNGFEIEGEE